MGKALVLDGKNRITQIIADATGFEIEQVRNLNEISNAVDVNPVPCYSLIVFGSESINSENEFNLEKKIQEIRFNDSLVPHLVYGKTSPFLLFAVARGGNYRNRTNIYAAESPRELVETFNKLFLPSQYIPNLTVVKIGGSTFDWVRDNKEKLCPYLNYYGDVLLRIFQERNMILTVGAGPAGDIAKFNKNKYSDTLLFQKHFPEDMISALEHNLTVLDMLFPKDTISRYEYGYEFYNVTQENSVKEITLMAIAPHHILVRDHIPLQDSDTHTIALAEFFGAERVVLVKRTDGIYNFDPYRGRPFAKDKMNYFDLLKWKITQRSNRRHDIVSVDDMLSGNFSREGTGMDGKADGSQGHLMEDSALEYFKYCNNVREICVVHIAPEEMHYHAGGNNYRHAITGEKIALGQDGWKGVLEQRLRDAVKEGKCSSKIVR